MAGSCSSDGLFMGLTWIFIALCLSDVVTKKRLAVLALCFGLTFHAKYTTLALLPLLLLLPFEQKPRKGKKALSAAAQRWGVLAVCLAAGVIVYALLRGIYGAGQQLWPCALCGHRQLIRAGSSRSFFPICRATWRSCSIPSTVTRQTSLPLGILDGWT